MMIPKLRIKPGMEAALSGALSGGRKFEYRPHTSAGYDYSPEMATFLHDENQWEPAAFDGPTVPIMKQQLAAVPPEQLLYRPYGLGPDADTRMKRDYEAAFEDIDDPAVRGLDMFDSQTSPSTSGDEMFDASLPPGSDLSSRQFQGMDAEVVEPGMGAPPPSGLADERLMALLPQMLEMGGDPMERIGDIEMALGRKLDDGELQFIFDQLDARGVDPGMV